MIAWVLVFGIATHSTISVSNIASEAACHELAAAIKKEITLGWMYSYSCFSYQVARQ